jgi:protein gp37
MGSKTGIEWTDATWNPFLGCSRVSEGCRNCYAEGVAARFRMNKSGKETVYSGLTQIVNGHPQWTGKIVETKQLLRPLSWKKPKRIFVNSMSDLFHENVTDEQIDKIFAVMALCPQHAFQVLTKRPERILEYFHAGRFDQIRIAASFIAGGMQNEWSWPLPNVWLGVSVENQAAADGRIPILLQTPAAVHFISAEPLLGPLDLDAFMWLYDPSGVNRTRMPLGGWDRPQPLGWVICGGESGPGARPMHPDWARSLRDQCVAAGVPFFFKQWGEWAPYNSLLDGDYTHKKFICFDGRVLNFGEPNPDGLDMGDWAQIARRGKKAAGHLLYGKAHQEFPTCR